MIEGSIRHKTVSRVNMLLKVQHIQQCTMLCKGKKQLYHCKKENNLHLKVGEYKFEEA